MKVTLLTLATVSQLIIAEARRATSEKPLLIVSGGPLTPVANALLLAPDIAPRLDRSGHADSPPGVGAKLKITPGLSIQALGKHHHPDAACVVVQQTQADLGGNTSVGNALPLIWKELDPNFSPGTDATEP